MRTHAGVHVRIDACIYAYVFLQVCTHVYIYHPLALHGGDRDDSGDAGDDCGGGGDSGSRTFKTGLVS